MERGTGSREGKAKRQWFTRSTDRLKLCYEYYVIINVCKAAGYQWHRPVILSIIYGCPNRLYALVISWCCVVCIGMPL